MQIAWLSDASNVYQLHRVAARNPAAFDRKALVGLRHEIDLQQTLARSLGVSLAYTITTLAVKKSYSVASAIYDRLTTSKGTWMGRWSAHDGYFSRDFRLQ